MPGKSHKKKYKLLLVGFSPYRSGVSAACYLLKGYAQQFPEIRQQFEMKVKDFGTERTVSSISRELIRQNFDVLCFSCYIWNIEIVIRVLKEVKRRHPNTLCIVGGPQVEHLPLEYLKTVPEIDLVVSGEGEATFSECLIAWAKHYKEIPLHSIPGISYRLNGELFRNVSRSLISNLDSIPSPYLTEIIDLKSVGDRVTGYETSRGCAYACTFCTWGTLNRVRNYSLDRIKKEIEKILLSPIKSFFITDAIFNLNKNRFKEILRFIADHNPNNVRIDMEIYAEHLDDESIELIKRLNQACLEIGLQTANPKAMKLINRHLNLDRFSENLRKLRHGKPEGIILQIDLIFGLPGDTYSDFLKSIDFALELEPCALCAFPLALLPGSSLMESASNFSIQYDRNPPYEVFSTPTFSASDFSKARLWSRRLMALRQGGILPIVYQRSRATGRPAREIIENLNEFAGAKYGGSDIGSLFMPHPGTDLGEELKSDLFLARFFVSRVLKKCRDYRFKRISTHLRAELRTQNGLVPRVNALAQHARNL